MPYRITGMGLVPIDDAKATLDEAAYTAGKMADNGVKDVRVFDPAGRELSKAELQGWSLPGWTHDPGA